MTHEFMRAFPLEDIRVRSGGDGRTVEAYAAVFETPAEIHDRDGHYLEVIAPTAFNKAISDAAPQGGRSSWLTKVMYNHGRDMYGNPSSEFSKPLGVPLDIRADTRGVFTAVRYARTSLADDILELIREGAITAQSFQGRFIASDVAVPRGGFKPNKDGVLRTVRRLEVGLTEFGPTPFPAYADASVVGVRSAAEIAAEIASIDPDERVRLAHLLTLSTRESEPEQGSDTSPEAVAAEEPQTHSDRHRHLRRLARENGALG